MIGALAGRLRRFAVAMKAAWKSGAAVSAE